jgi:hypothetical protein
MLAPAGAAAVTVSPTAVSDYIDVAPIEDFFVDAATGDDAGCTAPAP